MAITYPASYDALTNPTAGSLLTSPSHSGQHSDVNDAIEALEQRAGLSGSGFPGGPSTGQVFHHTTRRQDYYYDGTRWLSKNLYQLPIGGGQDALYPISASGITAWGAAPPLSSNSDVYLLDAIAYVYIGAGTALGASHKWVGVLSKKPDGGTSASGTTIATWNLDSGASDANRQISVSINALMNNGTTHVGWNIAWTKTGTPGSLRTNSIITYRLVG